MAKRKIRMLRALSIVMKIARELFLRDPGENREIQVNGINAEGKVVIRRQLKRRCVLPTGFGPRRALWPAVM
jgi:hypothetical protein